MRSKADAFISSAPKYEVKSEGDESRTVPGQSKRFCLRAFWPGKLCSSFATSILNHISFFLEFQLQLPKRSRLDWTMEPIIDLTNIFFCILIYDCYVHIGNTQYYKYSRSGLVFFANFLPGLGNHLCFVVLVIFIRYSRWNWGLLLSRLLTSSCKLSFNTWFTSHDLVGIGKLCSYGKLKR